MKNKRLIINLLSNIISFLIQLGISFTITPIITEKIGTDAYGFIGLANSFVSYASIFTVIINSMASRFITVELTKKNNEKANKYFSSVLLMDIVMSIIIAIISMIIIVFLQFLLDIPNELIFDVKLTFALAFINLIISIMTTVFSIATFAKNRLDLSAIGAIVANIIKTILLIILFVFCTPKIYYITFIAIIYSLIVIIFNYKYTRKLTPELEITTKNFEKKSVLSIVKAGIWNSINSLGRTLLTGMDLLIANLFISPEAMGLISISKTIPTAFENLLITIANIFAPQFIFYYSKHNIKKLVKYVNFSIKIVALIIIVPIAGFISFGEEFFTLWIPSKTSGEIQLIQTLSILALVPYVISMGNYTLFLLDTATNKLKRPVIATLIISIISTITTIICLKFTSFGIYAVAGVSSIYWCIKVFFFNTINAAKNLRIKWYTFYPQYLKNLLTFVLVLILFFVFKNLFVINSWLKLIFFAIIFAIFGYIIVFCILLKKEEKIEIFNIIKNKISKKICFIIIGLIISIVILLGISIHINERRNLYVPENENKSLKMDISNSSRIIDIDKNKYIHLSFDDVIEIFKDINANKDRYNSIFENKTLKYFKNLNKKYGVKISCYVFYEDEKFSLENCTDKYVKEFKENSSWLRFGFHSLNGNITYESEVNTLVEDYKKTIFQLERIVGSEGIDNCIRLQSFKGKYDDIISLKNLNHQPIYGLFTADDKRKSYYLDEYQNEYIYNHDILILDNIYFISTDLRLEFIEDIDNKINEFNYSNWKNQLNYLEIFSHEWCLDKIQQRKIDKFFSKLQSYNYSNVFFEDII